MEGGRWIIDERIECSPAYWRNFSNPYYETVQFSSSAQDHKLVDDVVARTLKNRYAAEIQTVFKTDMQGLLKAFRKEYVTKKDPLHDKFIRTCPKLENIPEIWVFFETQEDMMTFILEWS
jgi:hypothetical protein